MTLADLLNHWSIRENPFMAEEARGDAVTRAMEAKVPESLRCKLEEAMKRSPGAWDRALYELAEGVLGSDLGD